MWCWGICMFIYMVCFAANYQLIKATFSKMLPSFLENVPSVPLTRRELFTIQVQMIYANKKEVQNYGTVGVHVGKIKGQRAIGLFVKITKKLLVKENYTNFQCRKLILLFLVSH